MFAFPKSFKIYHASVCVLGFALICGCGVDVASLAKTVNEIQAEHAGSHAAAELSGEASFAAALETAEFVDCEPENKLVYEPPYPRRSNPFEFEIEVATTDNPAPEEGKAELKLFGFVGNEQPRAIIHIGKQTRLMSEGDRWGALEIVAIDPPEVRTRTNGLVRTWSLLGRGESEND